MTTRLRSLFPWRVRWIRVAPGGAEETLGFQLVSTRRQADATADRRFEHMQPDVVEITGPNVTVRLRWEGGDLVADVQ